MSESDGMEETFEGQLRVGLLIAGRVAEEVARLREQVAREAEAGSAQSARAQQEQVAADRAMARAALGPVERDSWWERARPSDVAAAWQTARTWEAVEPDARRATDTIRDQVRDRYGIDVDELSDRSGSGAAPAVALEPALRRVLEDREMAATGPGSSAQRARTDQERAVAVLLASESAEDRAAGDGPAVAARGTTAVAVGPTYDSRQRREAVAEDLTRSVDPEHAEAVEARLVADRASAGPVSDVVGWQSSGNKGKPRGAAVSARERERVVER